MPKIEVVKEDALVSMEFGADFYKRVRVLLMFMINEQDPVIVAEANQAISNNTPLSEWGSNYLTVLSLLNDMEESAKEQGLTEVKDIPDQPKG